MYENDNLPANHLRTISASMYMVEKSIIEMENLLASKPKGYTYEIDYDVTDEDIQRTINYYMQIREMIGKFAIKYHLDKNITHVSRILEAKNSRIWEILCDSNSDRLKGYGRLPENIAFDLDNDVSAILKLVEELMVNDSK